MDIKNKVVTIMNFECKDCHSVVGQLVTNDIKDENDIKCPYCGSKNCTYSTFNYNTKLLNKQETW